jgi:SH3-like domain-containing protein
MMKQGCLLIVFLCLSFQGFAKTLYINAFKADLAEAPSSEAKIIATLNKGAPVEELAVNKEWTQVRSTPHSGWVSTILLSPRAPASSLLQNKDVDISTNARKRASAFSSAAAARGLKADSDNIFAQLEGEDWDQVKKMETFYIASDKGYNFLIQKNDAKD